MLQISRSRETQESKEAVNPEVSQNWSMGADDSLFVCRVEQHGGPFDGVGHDGDLPDGAPSADPAQHPAGLRGGPVHVDVRFRDHGERNLLGEVSCSPY